MRLRKNYNNLRIRYDKNGVSLRVFFLGTKHIRIRLNYEFLTYEFVNAKTNVIELSGRVSGKQYLKRKARKELFKLINKPRPKERRWIKYGKLSSTKNS